MSSSIRRFRELAVVLSLVFSIFTTVPTIIVAASTAPSFNDPNFASMWERNDKLVYASGANLAGRGYTWGLNAPGNAAYISTELYAGKSRTVQYFDKVRMELAGTDVTTGLLVKELVTGNRQDGDNTFTTLAPSTVQIAGDPNDQGQNGLAPTYASFKKVVTFFGSENGKVQATGTMISNTIDKAGTVSTITPLEQRLVASYDSNTQHNIADVFLDFENQSGQIWSVDHYTTGKVFGENPTLVFGRPVTEPYWIKAVVGGSSPKDILVQLFERRVLTYTPSNPAGSKVEMGNVGQHYYRWRYLQNTGLPTTAFPPEFSQLGAGYLHDNGSLPLGGPSKVITYTPTFITSKHSNSTPPPLSATDVTISDDGSLLVEGGGTGVLAIDTATMTTKWTYPSPVADYSNTPFSSPMLHNGIVYVSRLQVNTDGTFYPILYALNLGDGTIKWQTSFPSGEAIGSPITDGVNLYFLAATSTYVDHVGSFAHTRLAAVSLTEGKLLWQTPAVDGGGGNLVFGFSGNLYFNISVFNQMSTQSSRVVAYNKSGLPIAGWQSPDLGRGSGQLAFANNKLYVGAGQLYALDSSGNITDKTNFSRDATPGILSQVSDSPAVVAGKVYFGATIFKDNANITERHFFAVDANNLQSVQFDLRLGTDWINSSPVVVNGHIFIAVDTQLDNTTWKGELYILDASNPDNRKVILTTQGFGDYSPIVFNGRVYINDSAGTLYAVK
jgi:hypothetical protein